MGGPEKTALGSKLEAGPTFFEMSVRLSQAIHFDTLSSSSCVYLASKPDFALSPSFFSHSWNPLLIDVRFVLAGNSQSAFA